MGSQTESNMNLLVVFPCLELLLCSSVVSTLVQVFSIQNLIRLWDFTLILKSPYSF